jgi:hypothetical protein
MLRASTYMDISITEVAMGETSKAPVIWPASSWRTLKKIVRAWYTAEERGVELTQKEVAKIGGVQQSRVSANKPFLQVVGIVEPEGIALTVGGKQLGLGLRNENDRVTQQALRSIIRTNPLLRQLWDAIRGRGTTDKKDFEAEIVLLTKSGSSSDYFSTGVNVLEDILLESGLIGISDNSLRPTNSESLGEAVAKVSPQEEESKSVSNKMSGLRQIPIAVSASSVWYIQIAENPEEGDVDRFIEMQRLIFNKKVPI